MKKLLSIISQEMSNLGIDYSYLYNEKSKVTYPYVTGEYTESEYIFEDNSSHGDMLLECWSRENDLILIELAEKIKKHFEDYYYSEKGFGVHIVYNSAFPVRTNDNDLFKYEIHLNTVYWKGN